ncbi:MAG TPA: proprotein convertase P-domain-containing protein [Kofleriaceae bacterium]
MRLLGILLVTGCAVSGDPFAEDSEFAQALTQAEAQRVLDLVNYPGVDRATLDGAVDLDMRAAVAIDTYRAGADARFPSIDDNELTDVMELDAVPYVGDAAFRKLAAYAAVHPAPVTEHHEGISFKGWQAEIVVWGANTVPIGVLNGLLDDRAAANVMAARPLANLAALAAVPLIGGNALGAMRGQATTWWHARKHQTSTSLAGTFDGVTFDEATARQALDIANMHTRDQMVAGGVYGNGASAIVGNRPYTSLAGVAGVAGVGASTMQGLHAYASALLASGTTAEDGECAATDECATGLICAGTTFYDVGHCRPEWMAGTFSDATAIAIPDNATSVQRTIEVSGLASVAEDLIVHLDIDHPRKEDLYIVLFQPSSAESLIWDVDSGGYARVVVGANLERDSAVNGTWILQVTDYFGGNAGTLRGWSLELTSRHD